MSEKLTVMIGNRDTVFNSELESWNSHENLFCRESAVY